MRKKIWAYFLLFFLVTLPIIGFNFVKEEPCYYLKILDLNPQKNKYILAPETINFSPLSFQELETAFSKTQYNFIFYIRCDYFKIEHQTIYLKLR